MPRHFPATLTLAALGWVATAAQAAPSPDQSELAKASGCFSCHSVTEKVVGPAFQSVAERYAGQSDAASDLVMSVTNGSTRKWGRAAMPPHGNMEKADIRKLVEWVLSQRK
ncbi:MAG: hypothetical protein RI907_484 [Pseudomonadota bacterium]|jgi:cytochrome c